MMRIASVHAQLTQRWQLRPATIRLLYVLAVLAIVKLTVIWLHWSNRVQSDIQQINQTVATGQSVIRALASRGDTISMVRRELLAANDSFLFAPSVAQATTVMAALLGANANAAGIQLGTINIRADSMLHGGVRTTTADGEASGEFAEVVAFLGSLDRGNPFFVRRIDLSTPGADGAPNQLLHLRFSVIAIARSPFDFER